MTLDLNIWEAARLVLKAMRSLGAQCNAMIDGTEDEDVRSEYGNDLALLEMTRERIEAAACVEFGPGVRVFSREPVGVTPQV